LANIRFIVNKKLSDVELGIIKLELKQCLDHIAAPETASLDQESDASLAETPLDDHPGVESPSGIHGPPELQTPQQDGCTGGVVSMSAQLYGDITMHLNQRWPGWCFQEFHLHTC